jgi:hypothetical protein
MEKAAMKKPVYIEPSQHKALKGIAVAKNITLANLQHSINHHWLRGNVFRFSKNVTPVIAVDENGNEINSGEAPR